MKWEVHKWERKLRKSLLFGDTLLWISQRIINGLRRAFHLTSKCLEVGVKKTWLHLVASTHFLVFGNVMKALLLIFDMNYINNKYRYILKLTCVFPSIHCMMWFDWGRERWVLVLIIITDIIVPNEVGTSELRVVTVLITSTLTFHHCYCSQPSTKHWPRFPGCLGNGREKAVVSTPPSHHSCMVKKLYLIMWDSQCSLTSKKSIFNKSTAVFDGLYSYRP